jgi:hypothetical protein
VGHINRSRTGCLAAPCEDLLYQPQGGHLRAGLRPVLGAAEGGRDLTSLCLPNIMGSEIFRTAIHLNTVDYLVQRTLQSLGPTQKQRFDPDLVWTVGHIDGRTVTLRLTVQRGNQPTLSVESLAGNPELLQETKEAFERSRPDFIRPRTELKKTFHLIRVVRPADVSFSPELPFDAPIKLAEITASFADNPLSWVRQTSIFDATLTVSYRPLIAVFQEKGLDKGEAYQRATEHMNLFCTLLAICFDCCYQTDEFCADCDTRAELEAGLSHLLRSGESPMNYLPRHEPEPRCYIAPNALDSLLYFTSNADRERFDRAARMFHLASLIYDRSASWAVVALVSAGEALAEAPAERCTECNQPRYKSRTRYRDWLCDGLEGEDRSIADKYAKRLYDEWRSPTAHQAQFLGTEREAGSLRMPTWSPLSGKVDLRHQEAFVFHHALLLTRRAILQWLRAKSSHPTLSSPSNEKASDRARDSSAGVDTSNFRVRGKSAGHRKPDATIQH